MEPGIRNQDKGFSGNLKFTGIMQLRKLTTDNRQQTNGARIRSQDKGSKNKEDSVVI
jgi:hypothetical protein